LNQGNATITTIIITTKKLPKKAHVVVQIPQATGKHGWTQEREEGPVPRR